MYIKPKSSILVVTKNKNTELSSDMYVAETDDDKRLITCTVEVGNETYEAWVIIVTGRYSLYQLAYRGQDYFFLDEEDVLGTIEEKNV